MIIMRLGYTIWAGGLAYNKAKEFNRKKVKNHEWTQRAMLFGIY